MLLIAYISLIVMIFVCIYICKRYLRVSNYLSYLFETAKILNHKDIECGIRKFWRMQYIKTHVSYNKMMFMFWKPVEKIFDEKLLIRRNPPEE